MRKLLLLYVFLFIAFISMSEDFHRTIVWKQSAVADNQIVRSLFEGALPVGDNHLPYWAESFALQSSNAHVAILDTIFEQYDGPAIEFSDSIGTEIKLNTLVGTSAGQSYLSVSMLPFIKKGDKIFKLVKFTLSVNEINLQLKSAKAPFEWKETSVLNTGKWTKIKVKNKGIYKITYDQLKSWGYADPESVVLYGNGGYTLPIYNRDIKLDDLLPYPVMKGQDNANKDCLFFYATGNIKFNYDNITSILSHQQNPYATETYFYLSDQGTPNLIEVVAEIEGVAGRQMTTFPNCIFHEKEERNLIHSGSE